MAYAAKGKQNTEHPFRTIVKLMDSGLYPKVLLLHGHEDFLVSWAAKFVRDKLVEPAAEVIDFTVFSEELDPYAIIAACETLPLMSQRKVVLVDHTDIFTQQPKDMAAADVQVLADYLPDIPDTTLLVFTCEKANKTKALYKACAKNGIVYDFCPLDKPTLTGWIGKQLQGLGKKVEKGDVLGYIDLCGYCDKDSGYTLFNIRNDLSKAAAYSSGDWVTLEDLKICMQGEEDTDAFALLDAAFSGSKDRAMTILHARVNQEQASKRDGVVLSFLGLLCAQLEIMVEARERMAEGASEAEVAAAMGANPYRISKALGASRGRTLPQLKTSLAGAYDIEKDFKSGNMDAYLAVELFIAGL